MTYTLRSLFRGKPRHVTWLLGLAVWLLEPSAAAYAHDKNLTFLSVLVAGGLAASAQTNATDYGAPGTPSLMQTNGTEANTRTLSLQDCVQMALQHNLDLQIDRYTPQVALYLSGPLTAGKSVVDALRPALPQ